MFLNRWKLWGLIGEDNEIVYELEFIWNIVLVIGNRVVNLFNVVIVKWIKILDG